MVQLRREYPDGGRDLVGLHILRKAKSVIEVIMPHKLVLVFKEHITTLNPVPFCKVEVVLTRLAVAVRAICRFPRVSAFINLGHVVEGDNTSK